VAGLDHLRRLGSRKWQAVVGSLGEEKVFVVGPYPSEGAAVFATRLLSTADVGYPGGKYVAYSTRAGGLEGKSSLLAACLQAALQGNYGF
jgi:hypothetical protein